MRCGWHLKWQLKSVLPLGDACKAKGKKAMKRGPINAVKARKAGKNQQIFYIFSFVLKTFSKDFLY